MWTNPAINSGRVTALCPGHVIGLTISGAVALVSQIWTNFALRSALQMFTVIVIGDDIEPSCQSDALAVRLERLTVNAEKSEQSSVRSRHPPTQWNLRGGR